MHIFEKEITIPYVLEQANKAAAELTRITFAAAVGAWLAFTAKSVNSLSSVAPDAINFARSLEKGFDFFCGCMGSDVYSEENRR
jgi:hypothetical protein